MKNILLSFLLIPAISMGQISIKVGSLPNAPAFNANSYVAGTQWSGSAFTTYKYSASQIAGYLATTNTNISNSSLRWNGDYTQHVNKHTIYLDSVNNLQIVDTNKDTLLDLNGFSANDNAMIYASSSGGEVKFNSLTGATLEITPADSRLAANGSYIRLRGLTGFSDFKASNGSAVMVNDSALKATSFTHITGNTTTPTYTAGTGAGTGPTISVLGDDLGGRVDVLSGTSCASTATVVQINFAVTYKTPPTAILLFPANLATANLVGANKPFYVPGASISTSAFVITMATGALTDATQYSWFYFVKQ